MATLIHTTLESSGIVARAAAARLAIATTKLPPARVGRPYRRAARAPRAARGRSAGRALPASLPAGLRLLRDGALTGTPTVAGTATADRCA